MHDSVHERDHGRFLVVDFELRALPRNVREFPLLWWRRHGNALRLRAPILHVLHNIRVQRGENAPLQ